MSRADDITRMQRHVGQFLAGHREQAETERACNMPAGSLAPVEIERPNVDEVISLLISTYGMTGEAVIDMLESFDYPAARVRHEVAA